MVVERALPRLVPRFNRVVSRLARRSRPPARAPGAVQPAGGPLRADRVGGAPGAAGRGDRELFAALTDDLEVGLPVRLRVGPPESGWLHPAYGRPTAWVAVRVPRGTDPGPLLARATLMRAHGGRPHWATRHDLTVEVRRRLPAPGRLPPGARRLRPRPGLHQPRTRPVLGDYRRFAVLRGPEVDRERDHGLVDTAQQPRDHQGVVAALGSSPRAAQASARSSRSSAECTSTCAPSERRFPRTTTSRSPSRFARTAARAGASVGAQRGAGAEVGREPGQRPGVVVDHHGHPQRAPVAGPAPAPRGVDQQRLVRAQGGQGGVHVPGGLERRRRAPRPPAPSRPGRAPRRRRPRTRRSPRRRPRGCPWAARGTRRARSRAPRPRSPRCAARASAR